MDDQLALFIHIAVPHVRLNGQVGLALRVEAVFHDHIIGVGEKGRGFLPFHLFLLKIHVRGSRMDLDLLARRNGGMQRCVILTARDALEDRVRGLDLGADDYVLKPFAMAELDARVRAVLRRPGSISSGILSCGRLHFDARARHASVEGRALPLSRREGMLLEELLRQSSRVVIKELLEERLYNYEEDVTPNAVEAVASRLRRKLLSAGADCRMETARGLGYRIVPSESSGERAPSQRRG